MPDTASVLAPSFVRALSSSSRPLAELIERLRTPSERGLAFGLHETTAAARPYLLAGIHGALGGTMLVVVPTADVAERTFADLTYYLGESESRTVALVRARDEAVGALDSPSERSARMTLLADLCANRPQIVVVPVAALRQYVMPCELFRAETLELAAGDEPGWEALQRRLYRLGYTRVDVVAAAGEFAVRGGILDVFPATAEQPVRLEFFGDTLESLRPFQIASQRSDETIERATIVPWLEILRDYCASKGAVVLLTKAMAIDHGPQNIRVNCICPGDTDTGLLREEAQQLGVECSRFLASSGERPLRRVGTPEEIAQAALYLASDASSFVTGTALVVDGGGLAGTG